MNARTTWPMGLRLTIVGFAAAGLLSVASTALQGAPPDQAVRFTIVDDLTNDVESDGGGEYIDHRLGGAGDECMETSITGGGFTFITLNRPVDGGRCDPDGISIRQYRLHINSPLACEELEKEVHDGDGSPALPDATSTGLGTCVMDGHLNPRIRVDRLRQSGGSTTIDFLIGRNTDWQSGDITYEVQSVGTADVNVVGDDLVMTYGGPFRLARFGLAKTKGKPGSGPPPPPEIEFDMSLEIVFRIENY